MPSGRCLPLPSPIDVVIREVVIYVVKKVFDLFKVIWQDDVFKPFTVETTIPSLTGRWRAGRTDSPERVVTFAGHGGRYQLVYDWRMFS